MVEWLVPKSSDAHWTKSESTLAVDSHGRGTVEDKLCVTRGERVVLAMFIGFLGTFAAILFVDLLRGLLAPR